MSPSNRFPARFRILPLVASLAAASLPVHAVTYVVTSTGNTGPGTLRDAITMANANCLTDPSPIINFGITGTGPFTIGTPSALPAFTCGGPYNPTVDGYSQPGSAVNTASGAFNGNIQIALDGNFRLGPSCALQSNGTSLTVKGLKIIHYNVYGSDVGICGNGLQLKGNILSGNTTNVETTGISPSTIGGGSVADTNVIIGASTYGANLTGSANQSMFNNLVGIDETGTNANGNSYGVSIFATGITTLQGNTIAGNSLVGVASGSSSGSLILANNKIGLPGIAGNGIGVRFLGSGGAQIAASNLIANNTNEGVSVLNGTGISISGAAIYGNGGKAISLVAGAPLPNDTLDPDAGPNNGQNYPIITLVDHSGGNTPVNFIFNSLPSQTFRVHFYANPTPGVREGRTFLGTLNGVVTDSMGNYANTYVIPGLFDNITATAELVSTGDTSEFSASVAFTGVPGANLTPTAINFGNVGVMTSSPTQTATYSSTGTGNVTLGYIGSPGCYGSAVCYGTADFICSTSCVGGTQYAPGATCTVTAMFAPSFLGPQTATVEFCDNAPGSPRVLTLMGTGVVPSAFSLSPGAYDFGPVPVGSTAPTTFQLTNTGGSPTPVTVNTGGSPFAIQNTTCMGPIPAGGTCRIDVAFTPTTTGSFSDLLSVTPSSGSPVSAMLTGTGTIAPQLRLPGSLEFFSVIGAPVTQTLVLRNTGTAPLTFGSIQVSGATFTLQQDCPATLNPGQQCIATLTFTPLAPGEYTGQLSVPSNAPSGNAVITLVGHASISPVPRLEVTPAEIGYGQRAFGTTSPSMTVNVKNIGGADVRFDSIVVSPDFVILGKSCGDVLRSLQTCTLQVAMRSLSYGLRQGFVTITSNAENSPNRASLFGTTCRIGGFVIPRQGVGSGC